MFHDMQHGEEKRVAVGGSEYSVFYSSQQSHGDNGKPVKGATVGTYAVYTKDTHLGYFSHGPHAETDQARKKGANPHAKGYAAGQAMGAINHHSSMSRAGMHGVFRDKRR